MFLLAAFSFMTVTFTIEAMSVANRFRRHEKRQKQIQSQEATPLLEVDSEPGTHPFEITTRTEMAEMANLFFSKWGVRLFYACIVIYLYGDLCIYVVAIPKSIQSVAWLVACTLRICHRDKRGGIQGGR